MKDEIKNELKIEGKVQRAVKGAQKIRRYDSIRFSNYEIASLDDFEIEDTNVLGWFCNQYRKKNSKSGNLNGMPSWKQIKHGIM